MKATLRTTRNDQAHIVAIQDLAITGKVEHTAGAGQTTTEVTKDIPGTATATTNTKVTHERQT